MRNRAKCKKCNAIIESFTLYDYVDCKCGEISIHGGLDKLGVSARDFSNFIRIDDLGNEIIVTVKDQDKKQATDREHDKVEIHKPSKTDLVKLLDNMISSYESLPQNAMSSYVTNYDLYSFMLVLSSLFKMKE